MAQTNTNQQIGAPAAADAQNVDAIASQLLDIVKKLESVIPDFEPHDKREISRVAASAKFAHELIAQTITTVTSIPSVPRDLFKVALAQEALHVRDQLRPIAQRLIAFALGLEFTIDTKLSAAGEDALQTYAWAKRAARGPAGAVLHPYVDEMRRVVKRALNRSTKPKSEPPAPSPAPQGQGSLAVPPQHQPEDSAAIADAGGELPENDYKVTAGEP